MEAHHPLLPAAVVEGVGPMARLAAAAEAALLAEIINIKLLNEKNQAPKTVKRILGTFHHFILIPR